MADQKTVQIVFEGNTARFEQDLQQMKTAVSDTLAELSKRTGDAAVDLSGLNTVSSSIDRVLSYMRGNPGSGWADILGGTYLGEHAHPVLSLATQQFQKMASGSSKVDAKSLQAQIGFLGADLQTLFNGIHVYASVFRTISVQDRSDFARDTQFLQREVAKQVNSISYSGKMGLQSDQALRSTIVAQRPFRAALDQMRERYQMTEADETRLIKAQLALSGQSRFRQDYYERAQRLSGGITQIPGYTNYDTSYADKLPERFKKLSLTREPTSRSMIDAEPKYRETLTWKEYGKVVALAMRNSFWMEALEKAGVGLRDSTLLDGVIGTARRGAKKITNENGIFALQNQPITREQMATAIGHLWSATASVWEGAPMFLKDLGSMSMFEQRKLTMKDGKGLQKYLDALYALQDIDFGPAEIYAQPMTTAQTVARLGKLGANGVRNIQNRDLSIRPEQYQVMSLTLDDFLNNVAVPADYKSKKWNIDEKGKSGYHILGESILTRLAGMHGHNTFGNGSTTDNSHLPIIQIRLNEDVFETEGGKTKFDKLGPHGESLPVGTKRVRDFVLRAFANPDNPAPMSFAGDQYTPWTIDKSGTMTLIRSDIHNMISQISRQNTGLNILNNFADGMMFASDKELAKIFEARNRLMSPGVQIGEIGGKLPDTSQIAFIDSKFLTGMDGASFIMPDYLPGGIAQYRLGGYKGVLQTVDFQRLINENYKLQKDGGFYVPGLNAVQVMRGFKHAAEYGITGTSTRDDLEKAFAKELETHGIGRFTTDELSKYFVDILKYQAAFDVSNIKTPLFRSTVNPDGTFSFGEDYVDQRRAQEIFDGILKTGGFQIMTTGEGALSFQSSLPFQIAQQLYLSEEERKENNNAWDRYIAALQNPATAAKLLFTGHTAMDREIQANPASIVKYKEALQRQQSAIDEAMAKKANGRIFGEDQILMAIAGVDVVGFFDSLARAQKLDRKPGAILPLSEGEIAAGEMLGIEADEMVGSDRYPSNTRELFTGTNRSDLAKYIASLGGSKHALYITPKLLAKMGGGDFDGDQVQLVRGKLADYYHNTAEYIERIFGDMASSAQEMSIFPETRSPQTPSKITATDIYQQLYRSSAAVYQMAMVSSINDAISQVNWDDPEQRKAFGQAAIDARKMYDIDTVFAKTGKLATISPEAHRAMSLGTPFQKLYQKVMGSIENEEYSDIDLSKFNFASLFSAQQVSLLQSLYEAPSFSRIFQRLVEAQEAMDYMQHDENDQVGIARANYFRLANRAKAAQITGIAPVVGERTESALHSLLATWEHSAQVQAGIVAQLSDDTEEKKASKEAARKALERDARLRSAMRDQHGFLSQFGVSASNINSGVGYAYDSYLRPKTNESSMLTTDDVLPDTLFMDGIQRAQSSVIQAFQQEAEAEQNETAEYIQREFLTAGAIGLNSELTSGIRSNILSALKTGAFARGSGRKSFTALRHLAERPEQFVHEMYHPEEGNKKTPASVAGDIWDAIVSQWVYRYKVQQEAGKPLDEAWETETIAALDAYRQAAISDKITDLPMYELREGQPTLRTKRITPLEASIREALLRPESANGFEEIVNGTNEGSIHQAIRALVKTGFRDEQGNATVRMIGTQLAIQGIMGKTMNGTNIVGTGHPDVVVQFLDTGDVGIFDAKRVKNPLNEMTIRDKPDEPISASNPIRLTGMAQTVTYANMINEDGLIDPATGEIVKNKEGKAARVTTTGIISGSGGPMFNGDSDAIKKGKPGEKIREEDKKAIKEYEEYMLRGSELLQAMHSARVSENLTTQMAYQISAGVPLSELWKTLQDNPRLVQNYADARWLAQQASGSSSDAELAASLLSNSTYAIRNAAHGGRRIPGRPEYNETGPAEAMAAISDMEEIRDQINGVVSRAFRIRREYDGKEVSSPSQYEVMEGTLTRARTAYIMNGNMRKKMPERYAQIGEELTEAETQLQETVRKNAAADFVAFRKELEKPIETSGVAKVSKEIEALEAKLKHAGEAYDYLKKKVDSRKGDAQDSLDLVSAEAEKKKTQEEYDKRKKTLSARKDVATIIDHAKLTNDISNLEASIGLPVDLGKTRTEASLWSAREKIIEQYDKMKDSKLITDDLQKRFDTMFQRVGISVGEDGKYTFLEGSDYEKLLQEYGQREKGNRIFQSDMRYNQLMRQSRALQMHPYGGRMSLGQQIRASIDSKRTAFENNIYATMTQQQTLRDELKRGDLSEERKAEIQRQIASLEEARGASEKGLEGLNTGAGKLSIAMNTIGTGFNRFVSRFGYRIFMSIINNIKKFIKEFDAEMNQIQMITLKTDSQMEKVKTDTLDKAINMKTSVSNVAQTQAALYRQGLSDAEVSSRTNAIIKFATVSGTKIQDAIKVVTTSLQTGMFKTAEEAIDVLTALGDAAATTAGEIGAGMQKAGAAAGAAGVSGNELATLLTIATSKTQLGGKVAGTAFQTLFSRYQKITTAKYVADQNGEVTSLNDFDAAMKLVGLGGIESQPGKFKSFIEILRELSKVWDDLSDAQKSMIANAAGGTRQLNNFYAIMEGFTDIDENGITMFDKYFDLAGNSEGIATDKYEIAMQSLNASINEVQSSFDALIVTLSDTGALTGPIDAISGLIQGVLNLGKEGATITSVVSVLVGLIAGFAGGGLIGGLAAGAAVFAAGGLIGQGMSNEDAEKIKKRENDERKIKLRTAAQSELVEGMQNIREEYNKLVEQAEKIGEDNIDTSGLQQMIQNLADKFPILGIAIAKSITNLDEWEGKINDLETRVKEVVGQYQAVIYNDTKKYMKEHGSEMFAGIGIDPTYDPRIYTNEEWDALKGMVPYDLQGTYQVTSDAVANLEKVFPDLAKEIKKAPQQFGLSQTYSKYSNVANKDVPSYFVNDKNRYYSYLARVFGINGAFDYTSEEGRESFKAAVQKAEEDGKQNRDDYTLGKFDVEEESRALEDVKAELETSEEVREYNQEKQKVIDATNKYRQAESEYNSAAERMKAEYNLTDEDIALISSVYSFDEFKDAYDFMKKNGNIPQVRSDPIYQRYRTLASFYDEHLDLFLEDGLGSFLYGIPSDDIKRLISKKKDLTTATAELDEVNDTFAELDEPSILAQVEDAKTTLLEAKEDVSRRVSEINGVYSGTNNSQFTEYGKRIVDAWMNSEYGGKAVTSTWAALGKYDQETYDNLLREYLTEIVTKDFEENGINSRFWDKENKTLNYDAFAGAVFTDAYGSVMTTQLENKFGGVDEAVAQSTSTNVKPYVVLGDDRKPVVDLNTNQPILYASEKEAREAAKALGYDISHIGKYAKGASTPTQLYMGADQAVATLKANYESGNTDYTDETVALATLLRSGKSLKGISYDIYGENGPSYTELIPGMGAKNTELGKAASLLLSENDQNNPYKISDAEFGTLIAGSVGLFGNKNSEWYSPFTQRLKTMWKDGDKLHSLFNEDWLDTAAYKAWKSDFGSIATEIEAAAKTGAAIGDDLIERYNERWRELYVKEMFGMNKYYEQASKKALSIEGGGANAISARSETNSSLSNYALTQRAMTKYSNNQKLTQEELQALASASGYSVNQLKNKTIDPNKVSTGVNMWSLDQRQAEEQTARMLVTDSGKKWEDLFDEHGNATKVYRAWKGEGRDYLDYLRGRGVKITSSGLDYSNIKVDEQSFADNISEMRDNATAGFNEMVKFMNTMSDTSLTGDKLLEEYSKRGGDYSQMDEEFKNLIVAGASNQELLNYYNRRIRGQTGTFQQQHEVAWNDIFGAGTEFSDLSAMKTAYQSSRGNVNQAVVDAMLSAMPNGENIRKILSGELQTDEAGWTRAWDEFVKGTAEQLFAGAKNAAEKASVYSTLVGSDEYAKDQLYAQYRQTASTSSQANYALGQIESGLATTANYSAVSSFLGLSVHDVMNMSTNSIREKMQRKIAETQNVLTEAVAKSLDIPASDLTGLSQTDQIEKIRAKAVETEDTVALAFVHMIESMGQAASEALTLSESRKTALEDYKQQNIDRTALSDWSNLLKQHPDMKPEVAMEIISDQYKRNGVDLTNLWEKHQDLLLYSEVMHNHDEMQKLVDAELNGTAKDWSYYQPIMSAIGLGDAFSSTGEISNIEAMKSWYDTNTNNPIFYGIFQSMMQDVGLAENWSDLYQGKKSAVEAFNRNMRSRNAQKIGQYDLNAEAAQNIASAYIEGRSDSVRKSLMGDISDYARISGLNEHNLSDQDIDFLVGLGSYDKRQIKQGGFAANAVAEAKVLQSRKRDTLQLALNKLRQTDLNAYNSLVAELNSYGVTVDENGQIDMSGAVANVQTFAQNISEQKEEKNHLHTAMSAFQSAIMENRTDNGSYDLNAAIESFNKGDWQTLMGDERFKNLITAGASATQLMHYMSATRYGRQLPIEDKYEFEIEKLFGAGGLASLYNEDGSINTDTLGNASTIYRNADELTQGMINTFLAELGGGDILQGLLAGSLDANLSSEQLRRKIIEQASTEKFKGQLNADEMAKIYATMLFGTTSEKFDATQGYMQQAISNQGARFAYNTITNALNGNGTYTNEHLTTLANYLGSDWDAQRVENEMKTDAGRAEINQRLTDRLNSIKDVLYQAIGAMFDIDVTQLSMGDAADQIKAAAEEKGNTFVAWFIDLMQGMVTAAEEGLSTAQNPATAYKDARDRYLKAHQDRNIIGTIKDLVTKDTSTSSMSGAEFLATANTIDEHGNMSDTLFGDADLGAFTENNPTWALYNELYAQKKLDKDSYLALLDQMLYGTSKDPMAFYTPALNAISPEGNFGGVDSTGHLVEGFDYEKWYGGLSQEDALIAQEWMQALGGDQAYWDQILTNGPQAAKAIEEINDQINENNLAKMMKFNDFGTHAVEWLSDIQKGAPGVATFMTSFMSEFSKLNTQYNSLTKLMGKDYKDEDVSQLNSLIGTDFNKTTWGKLDASTQKAYIENARFVLDTRTAELETSMDEGVMPWLTEELNNMIQNNDDITLEKVKLAFEGDVDAQNLISQANATIGAIVKLLSSVPEMKVILDSKGEEGLIEWLRVEINGALGGTPSGGGGGGGGGKSAVDKFLEKLKHELETLDHEMKMLQTKSSSLKDAGFLTMYGESLEDMNKLLNRRIKLLTEQRAKIVAEMAKVKEGSDDWYKLRSQLYSTDEALEEATADIEKNTRALEENKKAILQTRIDLQQEVLQILQADEQSRRQKLAGAVELENQILNAIRTRYQKEWELIKQDVEKKKQALQEEITLIDKRLQARKDAESEAEKYEELAELKRQYGLLSMDSSRTKEANELRDKIQEKEKELGWGRADAQANAQKEILNQQMSAYDQYLSEGETMLNEWLEDANNFSDEVARVMALSQGELLKWLSNNVSEFANSLDNAQAQMLDTWTDTWKQMEGVVDGYWTQQAAVEAALQDEETFISLWKQSTLYQNMSPEEREKKELELREMFRSNQNATATEKPEGMPQGEEEEEESSLPKPKPHQMTKEEAEAAEKKEKEEREKRRKKDDKSKDIVDAMSQFDGTGIKLGTNPDHGHDDKKKLWGDPYKTADDGFLNPTEDDKKRIGNPPMMRAASGGLINYTGPAWLDGTFTNPERVLSPRQTELFDSLVSSLESNDLIDVLNSYQNTITKMGYAGINPYITNVDSDGGSSSIGDVYVTINEATLKTDADYEEVAERVGEHFARALERQGLHTTNFSF